MASRWAIRFALAFAVSAGQTFAQVPDSVKLVNENGTEESGVIAWSNGMPYQAVGHSPVSIGAFPKDDSGQIVSFTIDRPPVLATGVLWTDSNDIIDLTYPSVYEIPVKFWILCAEYPCKNGIPSTKRASLAGFLIWANERLRAEHVGVRLVPAGDDWISDQTAATGDEIEMLRKFSEANCEALRPVMQGMKTDGALNVYIVQLVDRRTGNGNSCHTDDSAIVGRDAIWGTMLHEMGHDFSLGHVDSEDAWFSVMGGEQNLMCQFSDSRRYLSEGQVFRMHFAKRSGLNGSLSSHVNVKPTPRDCDNDPVPPCPLLQTVLWTDN